MAEKKDRSLPESREARVCAVCRAGFIPLNQYRMICGKTCEDMEAMSYLDDLIRVCGDVLDFVAWVDMDGAAEEAKQRMDVLMRERQAWCKTSAPVVAKKAKRLVRLFEENRPAVTRVLLEWVKDEYWAEDHDEFLALSPADHHRLQARVAGIMDRYLKPLGDAEERRWG